MAVKNTIPPRRVEPCTHCGHPCDQLCTTDAAVRHHSCCAVYYACRTLHVPFPPVGTATGRDGGGDVKGKETNADPLVAGTVV